MNGFRFSFNTLKKSFLVAIILMTAFSATGAAQRSAAQKSAAQKKAAQRNAALKIAAQKAAERKAAEQTGVSHFERNAGFVPANPIDELVMATLSRKRIEPANLCSDEVFVRRVFLDVIGTLPTSTEVRDFLANRRSNKRAVLVNKLMERKEFADYWSLKWGDILRVKAEFPINLWPNAVQAFHRWIHDSIAENKPYDRFARELLTSSGSNFRVPPVNFYRAIQGQEPSAIASAVGLTFLGVRVDEWREGRREGFEAFFSRVAFKPTSEWKEEIICLDPAPGKILMGTFPDGSKARVKPGEDPRIVFADWLITPDNPWFARNIVNRVWSWFMGRGIIHEPDDIRPDNPPVHPKLLAYLEKELVKSDYDLRHIYGLILNSRVYQQSSIPKSKHPEAEALFAQYPVRRLDAEVLIDALSLIFGGGEKYTSAIPEPFTFIPVEHRSILLADGSITSQFLEMYGRPSRDTGLESERDNEPSDAQRLHLLNSTHIQRKIERSPRLARLLKAAKGKRPTLIRSLYLNILSRNPTQAELTAAENYFKTGGMNTKLAAIDLSWALVNSKEFLYRH